MGGKQFFLDVCLSLKIGLLLSITERNIPLLHKNNFVKVGFRPLSSKLDTVKKTKNKF